jgi:ATP-dependent helicase/nuclease subunit A
MTRAQQALFISGLDEAKAGTWLGQARQGLERAAQAGLPEMAWTEPSAPPAAPPVQAPAASPEPVPRPLGSRRPPESAEAALGTAVHRYLELASLSPPPSGETPGGARPPAAEFRPLPTTDEARAAAMAGRILASPELRPFFDPAQHLAAHNELEYLDAAGQRRRIDRLVEFEAEVWVLDYKTGGLEEPDLAAHAQPHLAQLADYRRAMAHLYPVKRVRCGLIFGDGRLYEIPGNSTAH